MRCQTDRWDPTHTMKHKKVGSLYRKDFLTNWKVNIYWLYTREKAVLAIFSGPRGPRDLKFGTDVGHGVPHQLCKRDRNRLQLTYQLGCMYSMPIDCN